MLCGSLMINWVVLRGHPTEDAESGAACWESDEDLSRDLKVCIAEDHKLPL